MSRKEFGQALPLDDPWILAEHLINDGLQNRDLGLEEFPKKPKPVELRQKNERARI